jgi:hypothetical protein
MIPEDGTQEELKQAVVQAVLPVAGECYVLWPTKPLAEQARLEVEFVGDQWIQAWVVGGEHRLGQMFPTWSWYDMWLKGVLTRV